MMGCRDRDGQLRYVPRSVRDGGHAGRLLWSFGAPWRVYSWAARHLP